MLCLFIFSLQTAGNHSSFYFLRSFAFSTTSYCWNHTGYVAFQMSFAHLLKYICCLLIFSWLDSSFLSALHNNLLSAYNTLYVSIHILKDMWLLLDVILAITNKVATNICVQASEWMLSSQLLWIKTKECDCWIRE